MLWLISAAGVSLRAADRRLMAQGGVGADKIAPLWVVLSDGEVGKNEQSVVLMRPETAFEWQQTLPIAARVVGTTSQSGELVMLFGSSGGGVMDWAWYSTSRYSYGPRLPDDSQILAMAGDQRGGLWALGQGTSGASASSRPATAPATAPTTLPSGASTLYSYAQGKWTAHPGSLPKGARVVDREHVSMVLVQEIVDDGRAGVPYLAVRTDERTIRIFRFDIKKGAWEEAFAAPLVISPGNPSYFKLLSLQDRPVLWVLWGPPDDFLGKVWLGPDKVLKLELPPLTSTSPPTPGVGDIDLTIAGDQLCLFYQRQNPSDKHLDLWQQRYSASGAATGGPEKVNWSANRPPMMMDWWWMLAGMAAMMVILNIVLRRRAAGRNEDRSDYED